MSCETALVSWPEIIDRLTAKMSHFIYCCDFLPASEWFPEGPGRPVSCEQTRGPQKLGNTKPLVHYGYNRHCPPGNTAIILIGQYYRNKICARRHNMPRPLYAGRCGPAAANPLRLRRPARLASSSCGRHEYSRCTRQTSDRRQTSSDAHHRLMQPIGAGA